MDGLFGEGQAHRGESDECNLIYNRMHMFLLGHLVRTALTLEIFADVAAGTVADSYARGPNS